MTSTATRVHELRVQAFLRLLSLGRLPEPLREHRFHPSRQWRFDWAWPHERLALEQEGGIWVKGRHVRPAGFLGDMDKYNQAAAMGWRILRCEPKSLATVATVDLIRKALYGPAQAVRATHAHERR